MKVLTPTGYKDIAACSVGDEVSAFDTATGAPIVNRIESIQWVDAAEWARWWQVEPVAPPFQFYKINDTWSLNSEQSIWRNADNVCHVRGLVVGDVIFDDANADVTITSIEEVAADGWWRFDISGDHSYIVDGLTLHNASRFWVGGTGTWDAATTTHWAATTGTAGGQTVPGSADTVTFDANSGGGTVTVNFGGTITIQSITCGAFTGTLDFSANNNSVTLGAGTAFSGTGSGTRTLNLGNGTWALNAAASGGTAVWNMLTTTGMTFNANSSTIVCSQATSSGGITFNGGSLTYNNVTFSMTGRCGMSVTGSNTFATLTITGPNIIFFPNASVTTITTLVFSGQSLSNPICFECASPLTSGSATISSPNSPTLTFCGFRSMTFTGGGTFNATNSFDFGFNSGITITPPSGGGGGPVAPTHIIQRGTPY